LKPLLQTRAGRVVAAIVSGVLFYFVFGPNPYWLAAWRAPIPLLLAAFHAGGPEARVLARVAAAIGETSQSFDSWTRTLGRSVFTFDFCLLTCF
jgi:apolipoprotein N-acyltransferase